MRPLFVTGIGTDIGKTIVSALLVEKFKAAYWKPVQSGLETETDSQKVKRLSVNSNVFPEAYRLNKPASPHVAAAEDGVAIEMDKILAQYKSIQKEIKDQPLVIEGAGGIMTPLNLTEIYLDLISAMEVDLILVSTSYLGSINHTLLTIDAVKHRNLSVTGIVFNGASNIDSEEYILKYSGLSCLAKIPEIPTLDPDTITSLSTIYLMMEFSDNYPVWHPYTQMKTADKPVEIVRGEGPYLFTKDGRRIIDAVSSWWVNIHGHSHPYIAGKVFEQLKTLEHVIFAGFTHPYAVELSERILKKLPENQKKVFFSDNGSTAVEVALKMVMQFWYNAGIQKKKIIAFKDSYHGDTFGAMSVSARSAFSAPFNDYLFDVEFIDVPVNGKEEEVLSQLEKTLTNDKEIAGFIFEPLVLGAGGMIMYSPEVLEKMVSLCKKFRVFTIADEVMTGFGRTGKFFATDHIATKPDIFCLSKGLTGGTMPLGLTTCSHEIYNGFYSDDKLKTFFHGHSFTGNPVACAASLASLDLFQEESLWENIDFITASHKSFRKKLIEEFDFIEVRCQGTIIAVEIKQKEGTSYFNSLRDTSYNYFLNKDILLRPLGNVIYILPPYCISENDLQFIYQEIENFLNQLK